MAKNRAGDTNYTNVRSALLSRFSDGVSIHRVEELDGLHYLIVVRLDRYRYEHRVRHADLILYPGRHVSFAKALCDHVENLISADSITHAAPAMAEGALSWAR